MYGLRVFHEKCDLSRVTTNYPSAAGVSPCMTEPRPSLHRLLGRVNEKDEDVSAQRPDDFFRERLPHTRSPSARWTESSTYPLHFIIMELIIGAFVSLIVKAIKNKAGNKHATLATLGVLIGSCWPLYRSRSRRLLGDRLSGCCLLPGILCLRHSAVRAEGLNASYKA